MTEGNADETEITDTNQFTASPILRKTSFILFPIVSENQMLSILHSKGEADGSGQVSHRESLTENSRSG